MAISQASFHLIWLSFRCVVGCHSVAESAVSVVMSPTAHRVTKPECTYFILARFLGPLCSNYILKKLLSQKLHISMAFFLYRCQKFRCRL